jgi:hypothetical protein
VQPIGRDWGFERDQSIDRYYIERFLEAHASDVRGRVLEIQDSSYADKFGTAHVNRDVPDTDGANPRATIIGDLARTQRLPMGFRLLHVDRDSAAGIRVPAAVRSLHHVLKLGGLALVAVPGMSKFCWEEMGAVVIIGASPAVAQKIFASEFPAANLVVVTYGNVLAAIGFLHGLAAEELTVENWITRTGTTNW